MQGLAYWIEKRATITPDRVALKGNNQSFTYRQMSDAIDGAVSVLTNEYNIETGERVAVLSSNNPAFMIIFLALAKMGSIIVPLNTRLSMNELLFQVNDCQPKTVFSSDEFKDVGDALQNVGGVVSLPLQSIFAKAKEVKPRRHYMNTDYVKASSPFIICYTSGTTGRPKGAVLTQENLYWSALNNVFALDLTSFDRTLALLPFFHIGGIGLFTLPVLLAGGTVIIQADLAPEKIVKSVEEEKITVMMGVPTIFQSLKNCGGFDAHAFDSMRWLYSGGAPCPVEVIQYFLDKGIPFGQGYGLTEASPTVFMLSREDYANKVGSIGKPAMFCDIRIVTATGEDAAVNEVGELLVRGRNIIDTYWNLPLETEKAIIDGWFYTGDLVMADDEGFVYIAGRKKEMLISGGENVYPIEVEQVLLLHPAIEEAAVFGVDDEKWGEVPVASVIFKNAKYASKKSIINHCLKALTKYKCPTKVDIVSDFPRSSVGKVNKVQLKKDFMKRSM